MNPESDKSPTSSRIIREEKTIELMIRLFCRDHHHPPGLICDDCQQLFEYSRARLMRCPFAPDKPTCAKCPVHCYKMDMRERIRRVMRYSGPRMILYHPVLIIHHLLDGRIQARRKSRN